MTLRWAAAACGVVAAGIAAGAAVLPRALPTPERRLSDSPRFSREHLAALIGRRAPRLEAEFVDRLADAVMGESARAGYDPLFVLAVVGVESNYRPRVESWQGARGIVQLKPSTFAWLTAREPDVGAAAMTVGDDPIVDVRLAVRYLRWLEKRFTTRAAALMAYNAGPRRFREHQRSGEIPERLLGYARSVRREHERLARMLSRIPGASGPARRTLLASAMRFEVVASR